jgi:hypothetical protein
VPAANAPQGTVHALTADQARSQIEAEGYSRVTGLQKNDKGIWLGKAIKDGSAVSVTLDTNGKIVAKWLDQECADRDPKHASAKKIENNKPSAFTNVPGSGKLNAPAPKPVDNANEAVSA